MEWRNPQYTADGAINCEINHPVFGWIPFTAVNGDTGAEFDVSAMIQEMQATAADAPPAPPPPVPQTISRFQARAALTDAGKLQAAEAAVAQADARTQLAWAEAVEWHRNSPAINTLGAAIGFDSDDIDQLFRDAAAITA